MTVKNLSEQAKVVAVAEIRRFGEQITLPEDMTYDMAIDTLKRRQEYEEEDTIIAREYDRLPFDGAHALDAVLVRKFGWAPATGTPGMFGKNPPRMISVEVNPGVFKEVAWGRFELPNISGFVQTGVGQKNGRFSFTLTAKVKRLNEQTIKELFDEVNNELNTNSIYQGKAIQMRFRDNNGDMLEMPEPKFIDVSNDKYDPAKLIYATDVQNSIETNLFTPILRVRDCIANNISVKRGVILAGTFGTGKTLGASVAARHAVNTGLTYVYITRASELKDAIEFAKQYQSPACVIFCEDVDRVTAGERSVEMDDIMNILDGVETKGANIITVLTTNDLESINPGMIRPGRLDAVIEVTPPDAAAAERLIRLYGGNQILAETDLTQVGLALSGHIPATIEEVVKRAKLAQMRLQPVGTPLTHISAEALLETATTMKAQMDLLQRRITESNKKPSMDALMALARRQELDEATAPLRDQVHRLMDYLGMPVSTQ